MIARSSAASQCLGRDVFIDQLPDGKGKLIVVDPSKGADNPVKNETWQSFEVLKTAVTKSVWPIPKQFENDTIHINTLQGESNASKHYS
jgi:hypothetical protein